MIKINSKNISKLDLSNLGLTQFPIELIELKNLKKLNLSGNNIKHIPKEIEFLTRLEVLDLSNNLINSFYSKICNLKKLKVLNINNNKIKSIPIQIGNLDTLEVFHIANNNISELPNSFSKLKKLKELNLSKNDFEIFPQEILKIDSIKNLWINNLPLKRFPAKDIIEKLTNLHAIYCFGSLLNSSTIDETYFELAKQRGNSINELILLNKIEKINNTVKMKSESKTILKNKIFISYSHKDESWLNKVQTNLKVLKHNDNDFDVWDDTRIKSGDKWKEEIEKALQDAGIAILIVSTDFLASDFIMNDELPTLLRNSQLNGTRILPLIVRHSLFTKSKNLSEFQAVNPPDKPLSEMTESQAERILVKLASDVSDILNN